MGRGRHLTGEIEGETEVLTHEEVLALLTEMARKGSVTAAVALERALRRDSYPGDIDAELDRILETKGKD